MTKEQTKNLFRRIKSHYQEFTVDDFKVEEWYKELRDYDYDDVTKRFELHLNSEDYGQVIPKLWFLKKGLITIGEKKESKVFKSQVICQICGEPIPLRGYDIHYSKCSAIDYMQRQIKNIYDKDTPRELLERMTDEEFNIKYNTLLSIVQNKTNDPFQKRLIEEILHPGTGLTVNEIVKNI